MTIASSPTALAGFAPNGPHGIHGSAARRKQIPILWKKLVAFDFLKLNTSGRAIDRQIISWRPIKISLTKIMQQNLVVKI
jgi:hypothetical protein